jgi:uncharacterized membrane protein
MTVALLDLQVRVAIAIGVVALGVAGGLVGRRAPAGWRRSVAAILLVAAITGLGVLAAEGLVALTVELVAPETTDFNEFRWVLLAPWGRLALWLGVGAVAAIGVLTWWSTRHTGPWRRAAIVGLRMAAAALALVVFLQPAIELRQVAREPNRIAVLLDESRSMTLRDHANGPTRHERVRALIDASADTFAAWEQAHRIDFYSFSDVVSAVGRDAIGTTPADGDATLIRKGLESVRARYDGRDLAGIVVVSDGAATDDLEEGDGAGRDFLRSLEAKVHTVWAARRGLRDLAVARVLADEFAFVRTVVRLDAVLRSTGYGPRRVLVTLSSDGQALRQKWVDLPAEGEATVTFEVTPPRVGRYVYEIATPVEDDEAVTTNNSRSFVVRVIRDKIRVLQVAGQPSWDVRALRGLLEENPNVDLISFFILRTQDDISLVPNDELSLIPFPTRELFEEQLPSFDVIVLQNFEYLPYGIGDYLENIRAYVDGGGGLAMLGGDLSFSSGGYEGTPVAAALPVELLDPWANPSLVDTARFSPKLTDAGRSHPVTALRYATPDNLAAWKALPELEGVNLIAGAKPDATVLAVHPSLETGRRKAMPVIVVGDYGQGRSLAITTDTLWRWWFVAAAQPGDDGRHYEKLWENAIRWLVQDPDLRNLHVDSDAVEYAPGQPVRLSVRLLGRDYQPLPKGSVRIVIDRGADPAVAERVAEAEVVTGDDGVGGHELRGLGPGVYRVRGAADVSGREVEASDIFLVREGGTELDRPAGDEATLVRIAEVTGGRHLGAAERLPSDLAFDPPRIVRVDRRADVELWSRPGLLLLALGCLGLEWLLRQRSGYL